MNRVDFGKSLCIWYRAVLPGLIHAGGIWFNKTKSSQNTFHSHSTGVRNQYSTPSIIVTIMDLGWLPITDELDLKRIAYYKQLRETEGHQLAKIVFNELLTRFK